MNEAMNKSIKKQEVLVLMRGTLHPDCAELIHSQTGRPMGTLREVLRAGG